jgi:hypothetical protein
MNRWERRLRRERREAKEKRTEEGDGKSSEPEMNVLDQDSTF